MQKVNDIKEAMFTRLPKWAQQFMLDQERTIEDQRANIAELSKQNTDGESTRVTMHGKNLDDPTVPLSNDAEIQFEVSRHNRVNVALRESQFTPGLYVLCIMSSGCDTMLLKMHASNTLEIVFDTERRL